MATKTRLASSSKGLSSTEAPRDTFTVRDLNRHPQAVLTSATTLGRVVIQARDGRRFSITPELDVSERLAAAEAFLSKQAALRLRLESMGYVAPSQEDADKLMQLVSGEK